MTTLSPRLLQATPVTVDHARGSHVYGTDGRRYLDFTAGIGVVSTGHCHPRVVAAAQEHGVDHVVDWTTLRLTRQGAMPVQVMDPFATEHPAVDALLEEIRAQGAAPADPPLA